MSRKVEQVAVEATPKVSKPITLRLGEDLEQSVASRLGAFAPAAIIKRDLARYYVLLGSARPRMLFTLPEAEALVVALQFFDDISIPYLWAEVERQYLANDDEPDDPPYPFLPADVDAAALVEKLRRLSLSQAMSLLDAVEQYWVATPLEDWVDINTERLISVGLVHTPQVTRDEERRLAERGKLIARDPAANLRRRRADQAAE